MNDAVNALARVRGGEWRSALEVARYTNRPINEVEKELAEGVAAGHIEQYDGGRSRARRRYRTKET
jgi:predicted transcriptional regulator